MVTGACGDCRNWASSLCFGARFVLFAPVGEQHAMPEPLHATNANRGLSSLLKL